MLSARNQFNLVHQGYGFSKHRVTTSGAQYWYCKRQRDLKCKVKAYTKQFGTRHLVRVRGQHFHPPD